MAKFTKTPAVTPFNRRMSAGHEMRLGHEMDAVLVSDDGELWRSVRLCCGETVPETVPTLEAVGF